MAVPKLHVFITRPPGVGKTTLIRRVVERLIADSSLHPRGFYTEDVRAASGSRIGFDIVTLAGQRAPLACSGAPAQGRPTVGKYVVDVAAFEALALPELQAAAGCGGLAVIDEIGKMELHCPRFLPAVVGLLDSGQPVLASVPLRDVPGATEIKARDDVLLVTISRDTRDAAVEHVCAQLRQMLHAWRAKSASC